MTLLCIPKPLTMMMKASGSSSRIIRAPSMPSTPGMSMSMMTKSENTSKYSSAPLSPSAASPMHSNPPSERIALIASR